MLDRVNAAPWSDYPQPEWNKSNTVADALTKVARAESGAHHSLLYAVGNDHAGTYYPVLLAVMPFLEEFVHRGDASSQRTAMCVLDDLFASFHPEPGYEEVDLQEGGTQKVEVAFKQRMHALAPTLKGLASSGGPNSALALQLLELLREDVA